VNEEIIFWRAVKRYIVYQRKRNFNPIWILEDILKIVIHVLKDHKK